jgi:hypothetical protein
MDKLSFQRLAGLPVYFWNQVAVLLANKNCSDIVWIIR